MRKHVSRAASWLLMAAMAIGTSGCGDASSGESGPANASASDGMGLPRTNTPVRSPADPAKTLTLAVYQTDQAQTVYQQFQPLADAIQASLQKLGSDLHVELKIFKGYHDARQALIKGTVDFARFGPASYVIASEANPDIQLLVIEQVKGEITFSGLIVVRDDSGIQTLTDLKSKDFAFGDPTSTIGRYLAQAVLVDEGILATDLASHSYLGRHDKVLEAVRLGDFDAGALKESTFKKLDTHNELRVLHRFDNLTKPWAARADLSPERVDFLTQALVNMTDPAALKLLGVDGFVQVEAGHFDPIRQAMQRSEAFYPNPNERPIEQP